MYGVKSIAQSASVLKAVDKLDQIKNDTRKVDVVVNKCTQLDDKITKIEKVVSDHADLISKVVDPILVEDILKRVQDVEHLIFGKEDTSLYQENSQEGIIELIKSVTDKIEAMREEYVNLIGSYIENATPRVDRSKIDDMSAKLQKIDDFEKRISKLEERPKFQVTQAPLTKDNLNKIQIDKVKK